MTGIDAAQYKENAVKEWQNVADGWHRGSHVISEWSKSATGQMLDLAGIAQGSRVLDVAAGDGDQSIEAARRVGPQGYVLATDISAKLLAYADQAAKEAGLANVETRVMDAENLEIQDDSFDAAISRFGLMFLPNAVKGMSEIHRVLKPGGHLACVVLTSAEKNPWLSIPAAVAREFAQLPPPQPGQPGLFSLGSPDLLEETLEAGGFRDVQVHKMSIPLHLSSAADCAVWIQDIAGGIHALLSPLNEVKRQEAWDSIGAALQQLEGPDGFVSPGEVLVGAGTR